MVDWGGCLDTMTKKIDVIQDLVKKTREELFKKKDDDDESYVEEE